MGSRKRILVHSPTHLSITLGYSDSNFNYFSSDGHEFGRPWPLAPLDPPLPSAEATVVDPVCMPEVPVG